MPRYITVPFETDPEELLDNAVEYLKDKVPGWEPADGNLDYWIMQSTASEAAEVMDVASAVPAAIFRVFGNELMGLPPIDETNASTLTTWTMVDNAGYTIPAGTQVGIAPEGGADVAFETVVDVVVPPGSTATGTGAVLVVAVEPGAAGSGLGGVGATMDLLDPLAFVSTITMTGATSGGLDDEEDDVYLDRLTTKLRTMTPRPILPQDFAILARDIAGVFRAVAIDLYNPADNTFGNQRMVTVAAIDESGANVSTGVKTDIQAYLDGMREINFIVNVMDPKRTDVAIAYTVSILPGFDSTLTIATINTAIASALGPLSWGREPTIDPDSFTWIDDGTLRHNEVVALIDRQEGVRYVGSVTLNGSSADIALSAPASLPNITTITGTPL